jgi:sugar lactone lactonase YvrE
LTYPTDVILDQNKKYLIICDNGNKKVVRCSLENQQNKQILIESILCSRLMMNENGDLFVSDDEKHAVIRCRRGKKEETITAGRNGREKQLNQLNWPSFIFIDRQKTVYVSDWGNDRVMK